MVQVGPPTGAPPPEQSKSPDEGLFIWPQESDEFHMDPPKGTGIPVMKLQTIYAYLGQTASNHSDVREKLQQYWSAMYQEVKDDPTISQETKDRINSQATSSSEEPSIYMETENWDETNKLVSISSQPNIQVLVKELYNQAKQYD